jgi:RimJ/RimL family protein N-acetyltransferase
MFEFHPTDYTSSPINIARNNKMVAINTALEVDITGQVCADSIGHQIYSGIGGQADFVRGAALAPDGKPIIALPSTARGGTASRIVPELKPGAGVVTTRGDVHYIATEYGVAYLHGKSLRQRALALIAIAHPKFREELLAKARGFGQVFDDDIVPEGAVYPVEIEHELELGGLSLFIRPVRASDERLMQEYLYDLSARSVYMRFFQMLKAFPHELAQEVVAVDYQERMGIIATMGTTDAERIVAHAHWILDVHTNEAEVAYSVADAYQGRGIGKHMSHLLVRLAKERGIRGFRASTLSQNTPMRRIFEHEAVDNGSSLNATYDDGILSIWFTFRGQAGQVTSESST